MEHINLQSDDDAFSEVKGTARPENASGVEPSPFETPSAATPVEAVADPQAPRPSATAEVSHSSKLSSSQALTDSPAQPSSLASGTHSAGPQALTVPGGEPRIPSPDAGGAKTEGDADPSSPGQSDDESEVGISQSGQAATQFTNPHRQKPDTCRWAHSSASCSKCANDAMKARAA